MLRWIVFAVYLVLLPFMLLGAIGGIASHDMRHWPLPLKIFGYGWGVVGVGVLLYVAFVLWPR